MLPLSHGPAVSSCVCFHAESLASSFFFFFNDTATTEIYTLSLHDALPICQRDRFRLAAHQQIERGRGSLPPRAQHAVPVPDRKSTRLNSSHTVISYAVFCLKKKKKRTKTSQQQHTQTTK